MRTTAVPQVVLTPAFPPLSAREFDDASTPPRGALRIVLTWTVFGLVAAAVITATTLWSSSLRKGPSSEATIAAAGVRSGTTLLTGLSASPTATAPAAVAPPPAPPPAGPVVRRAVPPVVHRRVVVVPSVVDPPAVTAVVPAPAVAPVTAAPVAPTTAACGAAACPTKVRTTKSKQRTADDWDPTDWGLDGGTG